MKCLKQFIQMINMLVYNIDMYIGGFLVIYKRSPNIKLKKKKKSMCM